ncbi:hypothetical protein Nepgr_030217 [Nepenthes gracilis]|uniref:C2H2-type domain-containing protein n=1 Tax=Nepenthes gracilis TaxID=150966 RepID=A0AAD3TFS9_NEPGR|nr:hypothetical protein Nepgr_030217 [Nepenthes gracilis]
MSSDFPIKTSSSNNSAEPKLEAEQDCTLPCTLCPRKFKSAQALGGHQNGHRKERYEMKRLQNETRMKARKQPAILGLVPHPGPTPSPYVPPSMVPVPYGMPFRLPYPNVGPRYRPYTVPPISQKPSHEAAACAPNPNVGEGGVEVESPDLVLKL